MNRMHQLLDDRRDRGGDPLSSRYRVLATGVPGAGASGRPLFRRIAIIGHQLVNADWNRFTPTNSVNHRKFAFTYVPSTTLRATNAPAIRRSARSTVTTGSFRRFQQLRGRTPPTQPGCAASGDS